MKASEIAKYFTSLASLEPDMDVAILWWEQPRDDYDYGVSLPKEKWSVVVRRFERSEYLSSEADEFIMREIIELSESKVMKQKWKCPKCSQSIITHVPLTVPPVCSAHMGNKPVEMERSLK
jgi:hypothetical protein